MLRAEAHARRVCVGGILLTTSVAPPLFGSALCRGYEQQPPETQLEEVRTVEPCQREWWFRDPDSHQIPKRWRRTFYFLYCFACASLAKPNNLPPSGHTAGIRMREPVENMFCKGIPGIGDTLCNASSGFRELYRWLCAKMHNSTRPPNERDMYLCAHGQPGPYLLPRLQWISLAFLSFLAPEPYQFGLTWLGQTAHTYSRSPS